jgi:hypothetical protein
MCSTLILGTKVPQSFFIYLSDDKVSYSRSYETSQILHRTVLYIEIYEYLHEQDKSLRAQKNKMGPSFPNIIESMINNQVCFLQSDKNH